MLKLFEVGKMLGRENQHAEESESLKNEANSFQLATDGGYIKVLKYLLFILFGYYNARLFIVTVPGWEGYFTAVFALTGEATALYCFNNYTRSTGKHQKALGVFAILLMLFSVTHATISFFRMEAHAGYSGPIRVYCERVAFPLLFSLLLLAAIIIPLLHWRRKIAEKQAQAQVKIASGRAELVAEAATMRDQTQLERERLESFEERIKLGNEYVAKLRAFGRMKKDEAEALLDIPLPLRSQIAEALGIELDAQQNEQTQSKKPVVRWQGGQIVEPTRGN